MGCLMDMEREVIAAQGGCPDWGVVESESENGVLVAPCGKSGARDKGGFHGAGLCLVREEGCENLVCKPLVESAHVLNVRLAVLVDNGLGIVVGVGKVNRIIRGVLARLPTRGFLDFLAGWNVDSGELAKSTGELPHIEDFGSCDFLCGGIVTEFPEGGDATGEIAAERLVENLLLEFGVFDFRGGFTDPCGTDFFASELF